MEIEINPETERRLKQTLSRIQKDTHRDAKQSVEYMAVQTAISLGAGSKIGKKNRETEDRDDETIVKIYRQSKPPRFIPIYKDSPFYKEELKKVKEIKQRGLAKRSWMFARKGIDGKGNGAKGVQKAVDVSKKLSGSNPTIRLLNKLVYILDAYPNLIDSSILKATNKVNKNLDMRAERLKQKYGR